MPSIKKKKKTTTAYYSIHVKYVFSFQLHKIINVTKKIIQAGGIDANSSAVLFLNTPFLMPHEKK